MASNEADSDGEQEAGTDSKFFTYDGPRDDINYPISVIYCGGITEITLSHVLLCSLSLLFI